MNNNEKYSCKSCVWYDKKYIYQCSRPKGNCLNKNLLNYKPKENEIDVLKEIM